MSKRGQVTLFVIIAIIIVALALSFFFIFKEKIAIPRIDPKQIIETRTRMDYISEKSTYDILYKIGEQGGYLDLPPQSLITENKQIAYSLYDNKNNLPSLSFIENEISDYTEKTIVFYLNDYYRTNSTSSNINSTNFDFDNISVQTIIQNEEIIIKTSLPTTIQGKNDETFHIDSYTTTVPFQFGYVYSIAKDITERRLRHQAIDESYFRNKALSVDVIPIDSTKIIYSLKKFDNANNKTFVFNVAFFEP
ncbi:MAG: hypothetical protein NTX24_04785 [Candidatus Pacearchaeota archaeon]|nr:hypothetical protein [Candidatus Pacearchaeota archaeon]